MKKLPTLSHFRRTSLCAGTSAALLAASMLSVSAGDHYIDVLTGDTTTRSDLPDEPEPPDNLPSSLVKDGGGTLNLTGINLYQGDTAVLGGTLNIQSGSVTHPEGEAIVFGGATLNALNGALVKTSMLWVGAPGTLEDWQLGFTDEPPEIAPEMATATISGNGTHWRAEEGVIVGFYSKGQLTISDQAVVETSELAIGLHSLPDLFDPPAPDAAPPASDAKVSGSVLVTGTGSILRSDFAMIGAGAEGYLTITDGGRVESLFAVVGVGIDLEGSSGGDASANAFGVVTIDGPGSIWRINPNGEFYQPDEGEGEGEGDSSFPFFMLGMQGKAYMSITNGGMLENMGSAFIGITFDELEFPVSSANILVSGTGSLWYNKGLVALNNGSITLADGGRLRIEGSEFEVESTTASEGPQGTLYLNPANAPSLNIGSAAGMAAVAPGHLEALKITTESEGPPPPEFDDEPSYATVNFNHTSNAYTFAAQIEEDIEVNQYAGTTILTGESYYSGGTNVYGGELIVDGSITGEVLVEGGSLGGSGDIYGNVLNNAFVHPGNASQLTILGLYTQSDSGSYVVEFSNAGHDSLLVAGAKLDGNLMYGFKGDFAPKIGKSYTILSLLPFLPYSIDEGIGSIEGEFDKIVGMNPTILKPKAIYTDTEVLLQFSQGKFAGISGLTPNQRSVARALDSAVGKKGTSGLINQLNGIPLSQLPDLFSLLSPEQFAIIFESGFATAQINFNNLERRMDDLRSGVSGFSANGLALTNSHGSLNYEGVPLGTGERGGLTPLTLAGWDGKSIVGKQTVAPVIESDSCWGFFATGTGEWGDVENTSQAHGSDFTTGGITLGADYRFSENFAVGITGGYVNTSSNLYDGGKVDLNGGKLGLYATAFSNGFFVDATVGGGYNSYDTKRSTLGGHARGSTEGLEFTSMLGTGYEIEAGGFKFGPVASLQYAYIGIDGFNEHGSSAPLHIASQGQSSLKSTVGLKASYEWLVGGVRIKPEVRAQWLHEYLDSTAAVESSFTAGDSFLVHGPKIGRDGLLLDAGASVQFENGVSVFAYYTGELARTNYISNSVNGGVRIAF